MSSPPTPSLKRRPEAERQQIHEALVDVCREGGLGAATLERVVERAGVDRPVFERYFSDLDDCFAQYVSDACDPFLGSAKEAMAAAEDWRAQLRAVIYEMIRFWRADQDRTHMLLVETLAAGPLGSLIRDQLLERMVDLIDRGRGVMENPTALTRVTAEALAGALFNQMHMAEEQGRLGEADSLVPQLMYFLVLPYLGMEAAIDELSQPPSREA